MISETVKKHFYEEYGVSFRDLARDPKLIKSIAKTKNGKSISRICLRARLSVFR